MLFDISNGFATNLKAQRLIIALVLTTTTFFYVTTIRSGQLLSDDFAQYLLHARNIAEGIPYAATGYLYNRQIADMGPRAYPPIYPLIASPIVKYFGIDYQLLKLQQTALLIGAFWLVFILFRKFLSFGHALSLLILVGANYQFWSAKDGLGSDVLFTFLLYLGFYVFERAYTGADAQPPAIWWSIPAGLCAYLCYGARSIGIALILAILPYDWIKFRFRRVSRFALVATIVAFGGVISQNLLIGSDRSYLDQFQDFSVRTVLHNVFAYLVDLSWVWANGYNQYLMYGLHVICLMAAVAGFRFKWRARSSIYEVCVPFYLAVLVLWPSYQAFRLLLPLVPLYFFYITYSAQKVAAVTGRKLVAVPVAAAALFSYAGIYSKLPYGPIPGGVQDPDFISMCDFITTQTKPDATILFRRPRVLALYTRRKVSAYDYDRAKSFDELSDYIRSIHTGYVVACNLDGEDYGGDRRFLQPFLRAHAGEFLKLYENRHFIVYKVIGSGDSVTPRRTL